MYHDVPAQELSLFGRHRVKHLRQRVLQAPGNCRYRRPSQVLFVCCYPIVMLINLFRSFPERCGSLSCIFLLLALCAHSRVHCISLKFLGLRAVHLDDLSLLFCRVEPIDSCFNRIGNTAESHAHTKNDGTIIHILWYITVKGGHDEVEFGCRMPSVVEICWRRICGLDVPGVSMAGATDRFRSRVFGWVPTLVWSLSRLRFPNCLRFRGYLVTNCAVL